ncbi:hypothetical protein [Pseudoalteromonas simplex]|uniref:hypothetical protein n=1 Tax=Pseudoalteromonas simplex TaxID=2783613 RepID=UPI00188946CA|nr:hypothetical protein [Pseudoalteromonas sp. A520]
MYLIKRLLAILAITIALVALFYFSRNIMVWIDSAEPIDARTSQETRSNVQWLSSQKPLQFTFSNQRTHSLRILSNAVFDQSVVLDQPVNYAIKYVLYDQEGDVILDKVYHHASKLVTNSQEQQVKQIIENKQSLNVASGQSFYLPIKDYPNAASLDLTLIPEQTNLQGVVVRVHAKTPEQSIDPLNSWLKRPLERRRRATDYLTMGENTLTDGEIRNAMAFWWQKIAPQGIPDIDFKSDILYESLPYNVVTYDFSEQQHDLGSYFTKPGLCASIRLEETDSLIFKTDKQGLLPSLIWYDKLQFSPPLPVNFSAIDEANSYQTEPLNPGLVTICSEDNLLTQWRTLSGNAILTSYSGSYLANSQSSVSFDIESQSHLNIEVRALETSQLNVTLFDESNEQIESYSVTLKGQASEFDRLIAENTQRQDVGMLVTYYLRSPKNARRVEVKADKDVYVRLKSRFADFNYQRTLTHGLVTESTTNFHDIAAWYEHRANNHYELTLMGHFSNIRTFTPPAELDPQVTYYQSRELFDQLPISNVALTLSPNKYYLPKQPAQVFNYGIYNKNNYTPYINSEDNSLIYRLKGNSAKEANMADLSVSQLQQIQDSSRSMYQNWYGNRPWVKQRLYQLNKKTPLTLRFDKYQRPISLVFKVAKSNNKAPVELSVKQRAKYKSGLTSEYSIKKQKYQLYPSELINAFLIHPKNSRLNSYPSVTHLVSSDIDTLHSITIESSETIWLSILDEYPAQEQKVRWWNNEN